MPRLGTALEERRVLLVGALDDDGLLGGALKVRGPHAGTVTAGSDADLGAGSSDSEGRPQRGIVADLNSPLGGQGRGHCK
jgi:hypothetical protein